jgi:nicotinate dehydrogenase subunit B
MAAPEIPEGRERPQGSLSVVRPAVLGAEGTYETFIKISAD